MTDDERSRESAPEDERLDDVEVSEAEAEDVRGGKPPSPPGGPVPVPYPN